MDSKEKNTIFIVDDDADDVELFCEAARKINANLKCLAFKNGQEVLDYLKITVEIPDYIFLDLDMPTMNGKECLIELNKSNISKAIPVVIYSSSKINDDVTEFKKLGAKAFIKKPVFFEEICSVIIKILESKAECLEGTFAT